MKRILFDCGSRDRTTSLALFFLRVTIGLMMVLGHGLPKLKNFSALSSDWFVPDLPVLRMMSPQVSLIGTISAELIAASLLVLGLLSRPAAFVLAFAMVIAVFEYHGKDPFFTCAGIPAAKELALLYLIPAITILLAGPGAWSLDAAILRGEKRRRWS